MSPDINDPTEDREEFEKRVISICSKFDEKFIKRSVRAYLFDDEEEKLACKSIMEDCEQKIQNYLQQWDSASTQQEKEQIVSEVEP